MSSEVNSNANLGRRLSAVEFEIGSIKKAIDQTNKIIDDSYKISKGNQEILLQLQGGRKAALAIFGVLGWLVAMVIALWDKIKH